MTTRISLALLVAAVVFAAAAHAYNNFTDSVVTDDAASTTSLTGANHADFVSTGLVAAPPGTGRYLVIASAAVTTGGSLVPVQLALYSGGTRAGQTVTGGTVVASSVRSVQGDGGTLSGTVSVGATIVATVMLTEGQIVDLRWKAGASLANAVLGPRTIMAMKLSSQ